MKFYYGADKLVTKPIFNYGNPSNDYGLGFYLTPNKELARLWASKFKDGGYLIEFDVDVNKLNVCHLDSISDEDVLTWLSLLIAHRFSKERRDVNAQYIDWIVEHYPFDLGDYDAIVGYRADDSYFSYSYDFVRNELSLEILKKAMKIGKLGIQFVLMSEKAFKHIKYVKSEKVEYTEEYQKFQIKTRAQYFELKNDDSVDNTFLRDLMRRKK